MEKKRYKKYIKNGIAISVLLNVCFLIADLFNIPSHFFDMSVLNLDLVNILVSNTVIIVMFWITYCLIDHRNVEKDNNQRKIANVVLIESYDKCIEMLELFANKKALEKAAANCDFNKLTFQDPVMQWYLNSPFEFDEMISEFAKNGIITAEEYKEYLDVKKKYKAHINKSIVFFDRENLSYGIVYDIKKTRQRVLASV